MEFPAFEVIFTPIKESSIKLMRVYIEASGADTAIQTARDILNLPAEQFRALEVLGIVMKNSRKE